MINHRGTPAEVDIEKISDDESFRISRRNYNNTLGSSLKISGMLETPFIIKRDGSFTAFTCHNRIRILRQSGIKKLECIILEQPDADIFMKRAALKAYRNELGPVGKIKTLSILRSLFSLEEQNLKDFCTRVLKLNAEIAENDDYIEKISRLPAELLDYIDDKDINFRIIKDITMLPDEWAVLAGRWVHDIQIRVNIFRMIIDYMYDIYRRGDSFSVLESINSADDKTLHDAVFLIRYPEYSVLRHKAEGLINDITASGITVDFPEFFDRGSFSLKIDFGKKTDCEALLKRVSGINKDRLKELMSML